MIPPIRHMDASYDTEGRVDRLTLKLMENAVPDVAYIVAIEPNDDRAPCPTEICVKRRRFIGPSITDIEIKRIDPANIAYRTEAEAWSMIEQLIANDVVDRTASAVAS